MIARLFFALLLLAVPSGAMAQSDGLSLIRSYSGSYAGTGVALYESGQHDEVGCRLSLQPGSGGSAGKLMLKDSECTVAGTRMSFTGVMAFLDGSFQAAVSSNVGFNGKGFGRREGAAIVFTLSDGELVDRSLGLSASFIMVEGAIVVDMQLISNTTGAVTKVRVPMHRR